MHLEIMWQQPRCRFVCSLIRFFLNLTSTQILYWLLAMHFYLLLERRSFQASRHKWWRCGWHWWVGNASSSWTRTVIAFLWEILFLFILNTFFLLILSYLLSEWLVTYYYFFIDAENHLSVAALFVVRAFRSSTRWMQ